jgi:phosphoesterase RecJ-like protein
MLKFRHEPLRSVFMELITVTQAAQMLRTADHILIITHIRPDGDTAGSGCALCLGLRALGKRAYLAKNPPSMARYEPYMAPYFAPADFVPAYVAAVDTPGPGQYPPGWEAWAERTDLAIDHHGTNSGYARATVLEPDSAATGELVYLVLQALGAALTAEMASALYVALATDTNGFRTAGTTGRTLTIAGALAEAGADIFRLNRALFETKSRARLALEAYLFSTMTFPRQGVCIMRLPVETIRRCGATEDDMDKISLLTMTAQGTRAGVLLRQLEDGTWKLSLRTDGSIHAGNVFRAIGGGGHPDAAGAVLPGTPDALEARILEALDGA